MQIGFAALLQRKEFLDVTLIADGYTITVHRLALSAFSPCLRQVFAQSVQSINRQLVNNGSSLHDSHDIRMNKRIYSDFDKVFMKDVAKEVMLQLVTFIYTGEVNVPPKSLTEFLKMAESLKIKVLAGGDYSQLLNPVREQPTHPTPIDANSNRAQFQSSQINRNRTETLSGTQ